IAMMIRPKVIATPTWPSAPVWASMTIAPGPAKTSPKVPIASAASLRKSCKWPGPSRVGGRGPSATAPFAVSGFRRPDKGADDPAAGGVEARVGGIVPGRTLAAAAGAAAAQALGQFPRIVDARNLDLRLGETGIGEETAVFLLFEGAGDAAHPRLHVLPQVSRQLALRDDVRDREPAARFQDTVRLPQHLALVRREVDDAVRDDDVDRVARQRDLLDLALEEADVFGAGFGLVALGE